VGEMNVLAVNKSNQALYLQRNALLILVVILLFSNVVLSIVAFSKQDKTIIVPALMEEVSVTGKDIFSESYTEQMTLFFIPLLLDLTPSNIQYKSKVLLKYADSDSYHRFVKYFKDVGAKCKKYNLVTKFDVSSMKILDSGKRVEVKGLLSSVFGENSRKQEQVVYDISYKKAFGKLGTVAKFLNS